MKNKKNIAILVILLAVGFASVATNLILNGTVNLAVNDADLNVYFSNALENGTKKISLIKDKTHIEFEANLSSVGEKYTLDYEVTNGSFQYDIAVNVKVDAEVEDYLTIDNTFDEQNLLEAQNKREGRLVVTLNKALTEEKDITVTVTINAEARERTKLGEVVYSDIETNDNYVENNIPYFLVNVSNTIDNKLVSPGSKYTVTIENQEDSTNGVFYYVDSFGNTSSETKEYQSEITSQEYTFKDEKDENIFKVYVKTNDENNRRVSYRVTISSPLNESIMTGTVTIPDANFCLENGINTLSDCMIASDSMTTNLSQATDKIKSRVVDFNKAEPEVNYISVEEKGINPNQTWSGTYYFTETVPTLNQATGYYTWDSSTAKQGTINDYLSTDSKKYYTCVNQNMNGNCTTLYAIYESENGKVTKADKYTQKIAETAFASPGLYAAKDNDGDSYYYRGNVQNNYIKYANKIWRIVRKNGDGSVRLIYSGDTTSDAGTDVEIGKSAFNTNKFDPSFTGYVYGLNQVVKHTTNSAVLSSITENNNYYYSDAYTCDAGVCSLTGNKISGKWKEKYTDVINTYKYTCWSTASNGTCSIISEITESVTTNGAFNVSQAKVKYHGYLSNTYEDTYKDDYSSTIKGIVDTWYTTNIENMNDEKGNSYSTYLADAAFCTDRSIASDSPNKTGVTLESHTYYGSRYRLVSTKNPSLVCDRNEDKLTVQNGKLSNPIALLTADEVALAGGRTESLNSLYYLHTGQTYWTLSPYYFSAISATASLWVVYSSGSLGNHSVSNSIGVRPVLNLKSDIKITSGNGTKEAPYEVSL